MNLERDIKEIRTAIKNGAFANEAAVSQGVVLRLLNSLGWPAYDTQTVSPQYGLEGRTELTMHFAIRQVSRLPLSRSRILVKVTAQIGNCLNMHFTKVCSWQF